MLIPVPMEQAFAKTLNQTANVHIRFIRTKIPGSSFDILFFLPKDVNRISVQQIHSKMNPPGWGRIDT